MLNLTDHVLSSTLSSAASKICKSLSEKGIATLDETILPFGLFKYFSYQDLTIGKMISGKMKSSPDWHFIEVTDHKGIKNDNFKPRYLAYNLQEAVGFILDHMQKNNYKADDLFFSDDSLHFYLDELSLFSISKIHFSLADTNISANIKEAFKGIRKYGNADSIEARLRKIPGLEKLTFDPASRITSDIDHTSMISMVENLPVLMRRMLKQNYGVDVKHTFACELVAHAFGLENWNIFKGKAEKLKDQLSYPVVISEETGFNFYRNNEEAIAALIDISITDPEFSKHEMSFTMRQNRSGFNAVDMALLKKSDAPSGWTSVVQVTSEDVVHLPLKTKKMYAHISNDYGTASAQIAEILGMQ